MPASTKRIYVFAYDISDNGRRKRVSALLERLLTRVQYSVFEGQLTRAAAELLYEKAYSRLMPGDKLRMYYLPRKALDFSRQFGGANFPEEGEFWLL